MKKLLSILALISFSGIAQENSKSLQYVKTITTEGLKDKLSIIASDALEGRMTGTRGQKIQRPKTNRKAGNNVRIVIMEQTIPIAPIGPRPAVFRLD